MDIIAPIIVVFVIFMICTCCGLACKRKREGAIFSSEYQRKKMIHRCSAWILCQVDDIIVIRISCRNEPVANFVILLSRQYIGDYCVLQTWKGMFRIIVIKWNEIDPKGNIQLFLLLYAVLIERIGSLDRGGSCKTEPGGYKMSHIDIRFTVRIEIHRTGPRYTNERYLGAFKHFSVNRVAGNPDRRNRPQRFVISSGRNYVQQERGTTKDPDCH